MTVFYSGNGHGIAAAKRHFVGRGVPVAAGDDDAR